MKINDLTLIVPVRDRHYNLKRIFKYYSDFECRKIICDSSKEEYKDLVPSGFEYIYFGSMKYFDKMNIIAQMVNTNYIVECPDDDIIFKDGIIKCLEHMRQDPKCISCDGEYFKYHIQKKDLTIKTNYIKAVNNQIQNPLKTDRIFSRLLYYFDFYHARQHSVLRSEMYRFYFEFLKKNPKIDSILFADRLFVFLCCINGRLEKLLTPYIISSGIEEHLIEREDIKRELNFEFDPSISFTPEFLEPLGSFLMGKMDVKYNKFEIQNFIKSLLENHYKNYNGLCGDVKFITSYFNYKKEMDEIKRLFEEE